LQLADRDGSLVNNLNLLLLRCTALHPSALLIFLYYFSTCFFNGFDSLSRKYSVCPSIDEREWITCLPLTRLTILSAL
jgi:hypothetical protein